MNSADVGAFMTSFGEHIAEVSSSIKAENPLQDEYKPLQEDSTPWYLLFG